MAALKKVVLTDRLLKAMQPAPKGKRVMIWDAIQPHLGVRVSDNGRCSFVVVKRRAGDRKPTRHFLGSYPALSLAGARVATPDILTALVSGADPKELEKEKVAKARAEESEFFQVVADDYISRHVSKLRSKRSNILIIKRELLGLRLRRFKVEGKWQEEWLLDADARWRDRRSAKITRRDAVELIEKIAEKSRHQARKVFAIITKLFKWAILRETYGIKENPLVNMTHADLLGSFKSRSRVLTDVELGQVWAAAKVTPYPFGPLVQILMLSGQRLREISSSKWSEIDDGMLIIPAERMKAKIAHTVPLTHRCLEIISNLPRFEDEDLGNDGFLFTTTSGKRPVSGFSKMKRRLDELVEETKNQRGKCQPMPAWTLHDLRRTMRTRMSALKVLPLVAELVIAHKQAGISAVYDLHNYDDEKRLALTRWEEKLLSVVEANGAAASTAPMPLLSAA